MQILFTKTHNHSKIIADKPRRGIPLPNDAVKRHVAWRPQPSGLSRDEMRDLVMEMIG